MSKERLKEIKEDVFKCNHGSTRGYSYEQLYHIALSLVRIHGEWLIEQAERVQELEEAIADYAYEIGKRKRALNKKNEQNKRYREALNNIYELVEYDEYDNTLEQIVSEIEKALEV